MNYCVECKYIRKMGDHPMCDRFAQERTEESPVHGKIVWWARPFCEHARQPNGECGPDGKGWEKKVAKGPEKFTEQSLFDRVFGGHWV